MVCNAEDSTTTFEVLEVEPSCALMVVEPADCPVACPATEIEATAGFKELQVTTLLMFCVLPSL